MKKTIKTFLKKLFIKNNLKSSSILSSLDDNDVLILFGLGIFFSIIMGLLYLLIF